MYKKSIMVVKSLLFDDPGKFWGLKTLINGPKTWEIVVILILIPAFGGLIVGILAK